MKENHPTIAPSMLYAWAAITSGVPFANGAPNLTVDVPALIELARDHQVPICGKDFKTGQTLMKTILAPGFKARLLGMNGWFSTNILGNRDGEVLDDPESFKTKEESKLGVLEYILQPKLYPDLYGTIHHKVRINYYPARGDNKEGWDNIDIFGWLGYPMSGFSVPGFGAGGAAGARSGPLPRSRQARRHARDSGMAELLFQVAAMRAGVVPGA
jgi:myo-inositol-1-phosphate synthase